MLTKAIMVLLKVVNCSMRIFFFFKCTQSLYNIINTYSCIIVKINILKQFCR